jgi:peroxiredoxin Q/BCP
MAGPLGPGDRAPDFSLPATGGNAVSLAALRGQTVVLYFYPRPDTPGCTQEALDFNRLAPAFAKAGAAIVGVSADSQKATDKFGAKHGLSFALANDPTHEALEAYGVWAEKSMYGRKFMGIVRSTFLIGADGRIAEVWRNVRVPGHAQAVLEAAKAL